MHLQRQTRTWLFDGLILAVGLTLFFTWLLGSYALGVPDEGRYGEISREMLANHNFLTPHLNAIKYFEKPPLFYWLGALTQKFFGLNEFAVRLPAAFTAILGCLLVYAAARRLYDRNTGLLASVILATSILYFTLGHLATPDMLVSVCVTGTLLCFLLSTETMGSQRRYLMYGAYLFAALAVLAKGLLGILFPLVIIGLWIGLLQQWRTIKYLYLPSGLLLFLLIAAPWHFLVQGANPEFFRFYFIEQHFLRYLTISAGRYKPDWFFIPILFLGFMPWIVFLPAAIKAQLPRHWRQRQDYRRGLFLLLWAVVIFGFFSFSKSKLITYILPVIPPLAILVGRYLAVRWQRPATKTAIKPACLVLMGLVWLLAIAVICLVQQFPNIISAAAALRLIIPVTLWVLGITLAAFIICRHSEGGRRNEMRVTIVILITSTALSLLLLVPIMRHVHLGSIKPLVKTLKPLLTPGAEVAAYDQYYQDLPFYLQQSVTVVDSPGELKFGMRYEDTSAWMIDKKTFWRRWQTAQQIFVVMPWISYSALTRPIVGQCYLVAQTSTEVLLTNQPLEGIGQHC